MVTFGEETEIRSSGLESAYNMFFFFFLAVAGFLQC